MKTLKKTLCLVLAVVMVVGVLILPASAANTTTAATEDLETKYNEAFKVLGELGIYVGDSEGLRANDPITRREVAAVVARLVATEAFVKDYPANAISFADCADLQWGKEYIAYCEDNEIIAGDGVGFRPNDDVTGYEFAKMLLVAIGFDPDETGFYGSKWKANVYSTVIKTKLNEGLGTINWNEPILRGHVAQMTLNALIYTTEAGDIYTIYDEEGNVKYHGDDYNKAMLIVQSTGYRVETTPSTAGSIADRVYNGLHRLPDGSEDDFRRPTILWADKDRTVLELLKDPDAYYDGTFTGKEAKKYIDTKKPKDIKVYYNGAEGVLEFDAVVDKNGNSNCANGLWYNDTNAIRGYEVSIYNVTDDMNAVTGYKVIVREAYVGAVGTTDKSGNITLTVYEHSQIGNETTGSGVEFEVTNDNEKKDDVVYDTLKTFKNKDYVAVYMAPDWEKHADESDKDILDLVALEKKENYYITRIDDNMKKTLSFMRVKETADATTETIYYVNNEALCLVKDSNNTVRFSTNVMGQGNRELKTGTATLYLLNGNVLFVDQSKEQTVTVKTSGYAYCYDYKYEYNSANAWESEGGYDYQYISKVRLLLPDGKTLDENGTILSAGCAYAETTATVGQTRKQILGKLVYYELVDPAKGLYNLTLIDGHELTGNADDANLEMVQGKSEGKVIGADGNPVNVYYDSETKFMVIDTEGDNYRKKEAFYTIYNINTLPIDINSATWVAAATSLTKDGSNGGAVTEGKLARVVLIVNGRAAATSTPSTPDSTGVFFIMRNPDATLVKERIGDTEIHYYEYRAVVNNEIKVVKVAPEVDTELFDANGIAITSNPKVDKYGIITTKGEQPAGLLEFTKMGKIEFDHVALTAKADGDTEDYLVSSAGNIAFVYSTKDWSITSYNKDYGERHGSQPCLLSSQS